MRILFLCLLGCVASARLTTAVAQNVSLVWDQSQDTNVGVAGYMVYCGTVSGTYSDVVYFDDDANTSTTISNLIDGPIYPYTTLNTFIDGTNVVSVLYQIRSFTNITMGTTYYFMVTTMGSNLVQSLPSEEVSYTVPSTIPATTLQISTYTTNSITLNWNQSADDNVVGYTLYYGPASGTYTNAIYLDGATTVNATVNNLSSDANYYFMVKCKDNNGNESLPSNEATVTDGVAMQNTAFWLYYTNATWQSVTLAWNPPADTNVAYYELFYDTVSGGRYNAVYVDASESSYTFVNQLSEGTTYYFTVQALDDSLNVITNSNETVYNVPLPPAPTSVQVTANTSNAVTLTWQDADTNILAYTVYYWNTSESQYYNAIFSITTNTATVFGLAEGTIYYFAIQAYDSAGYNSDYSDEVSTETTPDPTAPIAPASVYVAATTTNNVTLAWTDSPNIASYAFYYGVNGKNPFQLGDYTTNAPATNFTYTGLLPGKTYYFVIMVSDGSGLNAYSDVIAASTQSASGSLVVASTNAPVTLYLQTAISPSGLPDPDNPFWIHITSSGPVTNEWIIQDSPDLINWDTYQYLSNETVDVWVTPQDGYYASHFFRLNQTNW
jgi:hypothetical protein